MRPIRPGRLMPAVGSPVRPGGVRTTRRRALYKPHRRRTLCPTRALLGRNPKPPATDLATPACAMRQSEEWDFPLPMAYEKIRYEVGDGGIATIALDDPDTRNSMSNDLLGEVIEAFEEAKRDDAIRCIVLTSTHEKVFSSGGNVAQFAADTPLVHRHFATERFVRLFGIIGRLGKPTICAANGHVLAGALGLALACDLIIAADTAEFGTPEINLGLFPFMIMALIYRNVPRKRANQMLLLGERMSAEEARESGIVNRVVPQGELQAAVDDWAK